MSAPTRAPARDGIRLPALPLGGVVRGRQVRIVERNFLAYRRSWIVFLSGFFEPVFYLFSIGIGVGVLVGDLTVAGRTVSYEAFVAPALLAAASMNGAIVDTTYNFFVKFKYMRTYDAVLATPMRTTDVAFGEVTWALLRGGLYAAAFLATMAALGMIESWWAIAGLPAAVLIGFAFAGAGLGASTYMRSFLDFDYVNLAIMPMFLFSATFFPLDRYPGAIESIVRATPLYQGVALERAFVLGDVSWALAGHALYLAAVGVIGARVAARRLSLLLQP